MRALLKLSDVTPGDFRLGASMLAEFPRVYIRFSALREFIEKRRESRCQYTNINVTHVISNLKNSRNLVMTR